MIRLFIVPSLVLSVTLLIVSACAGMETQKASAPDAQSVAASQNLLSERSAESGFNGYSVSPRDFGQWRQAFGAGYRGVTYFLRTRSGVAYALMDVRAPQANIDHPVLHPITKSPQLSRAAKVPFSPPAGVFVLQGQWPQVDAMAIAKEPGYVEPSGMRLDFTYDEGGITRLITDDGAFKIVALYEPNCSGCDVEWGTLLQVANRLTRAHVRVFLVTSSPLS